MKKKTGGILITIVICVLLAVGVFAIRDGFSKEDAKELYICLSDAFFVPGILTASLGLLMLVAGEGLFNIFGYAVNMVMLPFLKKNRETMTYYEYCVSKQAKQGDSMNYLIVIGAVFVLLGGLFAVLAA